jgi:hypothetical protein
VTRENRAARQYRQGFHPADHGVLDSIQEIPEQLHETIGRVRRMPIMRTTMQSPSTTTLPRPGDPPLRTKTCAPRSVQVMGDAAVSVIAILGLSVSAY